MTVIDCHCHIYPEKIADRAARNIGEFYGVPMRALTRTAANSEFDEEEGEGNAYTGKVAGTSTGLLSAVADTPITHHIVYSVATKPEHVESINDFIAAECLAHPQFVGFATMHQDYPAPEAEIERIIKLGLHGIKLHPDTQRVNMDDPRLMNVYEIIEGRLPLVMHCGDYRYDYSHPRRMKKILKAFPDLVVNAAHFGGWSIFDLAVEYLEDEDCFFDMSSAQKFLGPRRTYELTKLYGTDRLMFGSDFPMWDPADELRMYTALPFTDQELEDLTWHNAERFLGFEIN